MMDGDHPPGHYHWQHVLAAVDAVSDVRTAAHERVLRRAARFTGRLDLDHSHGLPHSMPPEDMVRILAVRQLAAWDRRRHADVIEHVARTAERDAVAHTARALRPARR